MKILSNKDAERLHGDIPALGTRGSDGSCNIVGRDEIWNYRFYFNPQATRAGNLLLHANAALLCC